MLLSLRHPSTHAILTLVRMEELAKVKHARSPAFVPVAGLEHFVKLIILEARIVVMFGWQMAFCSFLFTLYAREHKTKITRTLDHIS